MTSPYLHDLVISLAAPWVVLSGPDGQIGSGVEGVYSRDTRLVSRLRVMIDGREPVPLAHAETGAGEAEFTALIDWLGQAPHRHDPQVTLRRDRTVGSDGLTERITLVNRSPEPVHCSLWVAVETDLASTAQVRGARTDELPVVPVNETDGRVVATFDRPGESGVWACEVPAGGSWTLTLSLTETAPATTGFRIDPPSSREDLADTVTVSCDDSRIDRWVRRSLGDLSGLMLSDPESPADRYLGAGPPWYLTLFGRDSLISSSMLIAADPALAAGTLRALARRQGSKVDPDTAEQPGKIPHELRATATDHGGGLVLPPVYYGTHDATQLWLTTLHRAWRWGMPHDEVAALIPAAVRALEWMRDHADPDGDGFLEYVDSSGHGLANQGWKDSADSVQSPDGNWAQPPIALCEVQGYAYAAALAGAELLDAFDPDSGTPDEWRTWAARLKERFRAAFWIDDEHGGYPAIALDGDKRAVAGPASNMGHLLETGILDADDATAVAARLISDELDSGYGLRTMSTRSRGFNPLGYHTGSVWPHDTAMAVTGLASGDHVEAATRFTLGLADAAEAFGYRLPELYGGLGKDAEAVPTPYPPSCRPQAWAAASAIAVLTSLLGIEPDVPGGTLRVTPVQPFPWRQFEVRGLTVAGGRLSVRIEGDEVELIDVPDALKVL